MLFTITAIDGTDWHVQANLTDQDFQEGQPYVVTFTAKASDPRTMMLSAQIDQEDWHDIGLTESVDLKPEWKDYIYRFTAHRPAAGKNTIGFVVGNDTSKIWIKNFKVVHAPKTVKPK